MTGPGYDHGCVRKESLLELGGGGQRGQDTSSLWMSNVPEKGDNCRGGEDSPQKRQESRRSLVDGRQSKQGRKCGEGEGRASKDLALKEEKRLGVW